MPQPPAARRQRNGRPVIETQGPAEAAIAAQLAARPERPAQPARAPEAAAAVALAGLAAARAATPAELAAAAVTAEGVAMAAAAAAVLRAFDALIARRRDELRETVTRLVLTEKPSTPLEMVRAFVDDEIERERTFVAKARARLDAELPAALAIEDKTEREERVRMLLDRERRFLEQREDAIAGRVRGMVQALTLEQESPDGAFWKLSPRLAHCERCLALAGKVWPWSVLRLFRPPMHPNCGCSLHSKETAFRLGWATDADVASYDDVLAIMHLLETPTDGHDHAALWGPGERDWQEAFALAGREAAARARDSVRLQEALTQARTVPVEAVSVLELHEQLDVSMLKVEDLKPGDRIMVDGVLRRVEHVHRLGLLDVVDAGLVFIPRERVRGIPAPPAPVALLMTFEQSTAAATMDRPVEAAHVAPLVYYSPTTSEAVADETLLRVGPEFFAWSRERRLAVVFGYLAGRIADALGVDGEERAKVVTTYLALTVGGRYVADAETRGRVIETALLLGYPLRETTS